MYFCQTIYKEILFDGKFLRLDADRISSIFNTGSSRYNCHIMHLNNVRVELTAACRMIFMSVDLSVFRNMKVVAITTMNVMG